MPVVRRLLSEENQGNNNANENIKGTFKWLHLSCSHNNAAGSTSKYKAPPINIH